MATAADSKRYTPLDSLRGLAALTVVFCHYMTRFDLSGIGDCFSGAFLNRAMYVLKHTPLHILWAGHEAVILFFILSGFVLTLSFLGSDSRYQSYWIKRICRIYIPYIVIILCAIILRNLCYTGRIEGLSIDFNSSWRPTADETKAIIDHFIMIGNYDTSAYNGSIWSLVHEMRISLVFPLIFFFCKKYGSAVSMTAAFALSFCTYLLLESYPFLPNDSIMTLHYAAFFILGSVIAIHREWLIKKLRALGGPTWGLILCFAVASYTYSGWGDIFGQRPPVCIVNDWIIAMGASLFIIASLSLENMKRALSSKFLMSLGKISYSLYLWHIVILNTLIHKLYGKAPMALILPAAFVTTVLISWFSYRYIEVPAMKMGRKFSERLAAAGPLHRKKFFDISE